MGNEGSGAVVITGGGVMVAVVGVGLVAVVITGGVVAVVVTSGGVGLSEVVITGVVGTTVGPVVAGSQLAVTVTSFAGMKKLAVALLGRLTPPAFTVQPTKINPGRMPALTVTATPAAYVPAPVFPDPA
ncbi:MAG: hypothetical protein FWH51_05385 [Dehalococcoidia bacterium]|nr:hypothetical protein [Dehalococcoidia bacterium]